METGHIQDGSKLHFFLFFYVLHETINTRFPGNEVNDGITVKFP